MVWALTTFNVTRTALGLPCAPPGAVMVTVPMYWPGCRLPEFTATVTVPGVFPEAGVAVSQLPPASVVAFTAKAITPGAPVTLNVWDAGADPPAAWVKVRVSGVTVIVPPLTWTVTGTTVGLLPAKAVVEVMVTVPL